MLITTQLVYGIIQEIKEAVEENNFSNLSSEFIEPSISIYLQKDCFEIHRSIVKIFA